MTHLYIFIYIISFFTGVACLSILMLYKNDFPKMFGLDFNLMRKFLVAFFSFFAVNFLIFYNEYLIREAIMKSVLLVIFDILLILSVYYVIKLNCIGNEGLVEKIFLITGIIYMVMWTPVYFFEFSWFPPLKPITEFIADAILSSVTSAILIIYSLYQHKRNCDLWEKKYLITLNVIISVYTCMLYCADLFTELSRAYVSLEAEYPYLYDPIFIIFIIVNVYTAAYLIISAKQVRSTGFTEIFEVQETEEKADILEKVSAREKEVIELIIKGMNNTEIAEELCISVYTVKRHVNNIFKMLEVKSRFELLCRIQELK